MITASNFGTKILNALFTSDSNITFPSKPYLGLFTAMPAADGTGGTEVSAEEYARINLAAVGVHGKAYMGDATVADGEGEDTGKKVAKITNQDEIHYQIIPAGGSWGTIVGFGVFDAASGGTPYFWGELTAPVETGSEASKTAVFFDIGDFSVTLV